jgi:hypothetical protein
LAIGELAKLAHFLRIRRLGCDVKATTIKPLITILASPKVAENSFRQFILMVTEYRAAGWDAVRHPAVHDLLRRV